MKNLLADIQSNVYTHIIKSSKQKCFLVPFWPTSDKKFKEEQKVRPLVQTENGQQLRIRRENLTTFQYEKNAKKQVSRYLLSELKIVTQ